MSDARNQQRRTLRLVPTTLRTLTAIPSAPHTKQTQQGPTCVVDAEPRLR
jgi:hypothetical protein